MAKRPVIKNGKCDHAVEELCPHYNEAEELVKKNAEKDKRIEELESAQTFKESDFFGEFALCDNCQNPAPGKVVGLDGAGKCIDCGRRYMTDMGGLTFKNAELRESAKRADLWKDRESATQAKYEAVCYERDILKTEVAELQEKVKVGGKNYISAVNDRKEMRKGLRKYRSERDTLKDAMEYMVKKENWYVDKDGWATLLRPRDSYITGEVPAYIAPWEFIAETLSKIKRG